ncbi:MAG: VanZ family protein [Candidatus Marinimicrobia bacterium]|nr:VanZ family protein [Candidatus Neomarinimicrobiota bacterium]
MIDRKPQKLIFLFYLILVVLISTIPSSMLQIGKLWRFDKYIHFIEYLFLGALLLNCITPKKYSPILLIFTLLFVIIFSGIDEFIVQKYFGRGRFPDLMDWKMDSIGAGTGILIRYFISKKIT